MAAWRRKVAESQPKEKERADGCLPRNFVPLPSQDSGPARRQSGDFAKALASLALLGIAGSRILIKYGCVPPAGSRNAQTSTSRTWPSQTIVTDTHIKLKCKSPLLVAILKEVTVQGELNTSGSSAPPLSLATAPINIESSLPSLIMSSQDQHAPVPAPTAAATTAATASEAPRQHAAADDNLACQWDKCTEHCESPEALYVSLLCLSLCSAPHLTLVFNPYYINISKGAHLRASCWTEEYQQLELDLWMEPVSYYHCQTRPHHFPHSCPCPS